VTKEQMRLLLRYIDKAVSQCQHSSHEGFVELDKLRTKLLQSAKQPTKEGETK
jgi:hypothetical protein